MEVLSFMLGVSAVLIILGVVFMFGMNKKIKQNSDMLSSTINIQNDIFRQLDSIKDEINRRIDEESKNVHIVHRELETDTILKFEESNRQLGREVEKLLQALQVVDSQLRRDIDSRFDKLENKLKLKTSKEVL